MNEADHIKKILKLKGIFGRSCIILLTMSHALLQILKPYCKYIKEKTNEARLTAATYLALKI